MKEVDQVHPRFGACIKVENNWDITFQHWDIDNCSGDQRAVMLAILEWIRKRIAGEAADGGGSYHLGACDISPAQQEKTP